jgi:site-specific DNA-methyltransferase (adenine-specific)
VNGNGRGPRELGAMMQSSDSWPSDGQETVLGADPVSHVTEPLPAPYFAADGITLYHGDARLIAPTLELEAVLVLTDPPYNCGVNYGELTNDRRPWPEWCAWWDDCLRIFQAISPTVFAFMSQTAWKHYQRVGAYEIDWTLIWSKPLSLGITALPFMPHWEPIGYWGTTQRKRDAAFWGSDVYTCNVTPNVFGHKTEKPLLLLREMVRRLTQPGDLILDPFAGSGTTLAAAQIESRQAVGVEIEERYCEIIARRLERGDAGARTPQQGMLWAGGGE